MTKKHGVIKLLRAFIITGIIVAALRFFVPGLFHTSVAY
jgi:hypothetical protein